MSTQSYVSTLIEETSSKLVKYCAIPMLKSQPSYKKEMDLFLQRVVSKCEMEVKYIPDDDEDEEGCEYDGVKHRTWLELADMLYGGLFSSDNINLDMNLQEEMMECQEKAQDILYDFIDTLIKNM